MKNQECYDKNGKFLGWYSRSVAVVNVTFSYGQNNELYVLASKRGKGTPDPEYVGKWNVTCGYLDFDETCQEAALRETFEETGIKPDRIWFWGLKSNPKTDKRQNVSIRYVSKVEGLPNTTNKNSELNEVDDIKWIPILDIDKYEWAFNHDSIIKSALNYFYRKVL